MTQLPSNKLIKCYKLKYLIQYKPSFTGDKKIYLFFSIA